MKLADRISQCSAPYVVEDLNTGKHTELNNSASCAKDVARCPLRFVLCDELTRLCTALAYSKGAQTLECADLLRVPASLLWVEWREHPQQHELSRYGFSDASTLSNHEGRRGALISCSPDGRRGFVRTFWAEGSTTEVLASNVEAYYDLDVPSNEKPMPPDELTSPVLGTFDSSHKGADLLQRYFRFQYERTWRDYYEQTALSRTQRDTLARSALNTIAIDIPVVFAFLLLLGTRSSLPRRVETFSRLNRIRLKAGKRPLLEHIEVSCPMIPAFHAPDCSHSTGIRRAPRLHHVRGHLFRRGSEVFWRVPHLRGNARAGLVRSRTVTWTFEHNSQHFATETSTTVPST